VPVHLGDSTRVHHLKEVKREKGKKRKRSGPQKLYQQTGKSSVNGNYSVFKGGSPEKLTGGKMAGREGEHVTVGGPDSKREKLQGSTLLKEERDFL